VKRRPALGPSCRAGPIRGAVGLGSARGWGKRVEPEPEGLRARIEPDQKWSWCPGPVGPNGSDPARGQGAHTDGVCAPV
jgi:hypothetical protein